MSIAQKILANPEKFSIGMLQQGVQNGVIPAYIGIPLIKEKLETQKQTAATAPTDQQGPPLAEQVMAEASGVSTLPTNLPRAYAGGGIIAFDEGGEVPRYQSQGLVSAYETPYDRMNRENRERAAAREKMTPEERAAEARRDRAAMGAPFAAAGDVLLGGPYNYLAQTGESLANAVGVPRLGRALGIYDPDVKSVTIPRIGQGGNTPYMDMVRRYAAGQSTPTAPAAPTPAPAAPPPDAPPAAAGTKGGIDQLLGSLGLGGSSALGRTPGVGLQPSKLPEPPPGQTMSDMVQRQLYGTETEPGFLARSEARDRRLAEDLSKNRLEGKAFEGLEASLKKEAEEAGADKEQAKAMALFKAGLAMMSGTSRFAAENIGKGALVGAEDYQIAARELKKAEKERQRQFAYIEQARRAEDQDNLKRRDALLTKASESAQKRDEFGVNAIMNGFGKDREQATEIWKTQFSGEKALQAADLSGRYSLAGHELSGKYHLAGSLLSAMGKERLTPYQEKRLEVEFNKQNPIDDTRAMVAKQLKLSKVPAAGADKTFDDTVSRVHAMKFQEFLYGPSTGAAPTNPYAGFKLVP